MQSFDRHCKLLSTSPEVRRCRERSQPTNVYRASGQLLLERQERAVVTVAIEDRYSEAIHPLHAVLLAGSVPLFLIATLGDIAYARTFEIQWINFASWLIVAGLLLSGIALLFAIADLARAHRRAYGLPLYAAILLATWMLGLFDAFMHARDAWGSMPGGLVLSLLTTALACVATWFGFSTPRVRNVT
jgi:uncharacterized membrane protein